MAEYELCQKMNDILDQNSPFHVRDDCNISYTRGDDSSSEEDEVVETVFNTNFNRAKEELGRFNRWKVWHSFLSYPMFSQYYGLWYNVKHLFV